jgi:hypothetical protein
MCKTHIIVRKQTEGEVQYNDGEFAEIQTSGIDGIEKDLLLDTIQIDRDDTGDTPEVFKRKLEVGMWFDITTETVFTAQQPVVERT